MIIAGDIVVEVLEVRGQIVKLGFDAPRSVQIYREEIWAAVKRENEAAALGGDIDMSLMTGPVPARPASPASPVSSASPASPAPGRPPAA